MTRRSLALAALLALASGLLWFVGGDSRPAAIEHALDGEIDSSRSAPEVPAAPLAVSAGVAAQAPGEHRIEDALQAPPQVQAIPDDAHWIAGRLTLPADTPADEQPTIVARGKRLGSGLKSPREYRTRPDAQGLFRLPFGKGTTTGSVWIESRHLYLEGRLRLKLGEQQSELVLEPKLGGRLAGQVDLETQLASRADIHQGLRVAVRDKTQQWSTDVGPDGRFEVNGIPPGVDYTVELQSEEFHGESRAGLRVRAGRTLEQKLSLLRGIRIAGRAIGPAGTPLAGGTVILQVTSRRGSDKPSFSRIRPCTKDGSFEFRGAQPGDASLTLLCDGYREVEEHVGILKSGEVAEALVLTPPLGASIAGHVRWPDGKAAAGLRVSVRQAAAGSKIQMSERSFSATTDQNGAFRVEGLGDGMLVLECSAHAPGPDGNKLRGKDRGPLLKARLAQQEPNAIGLLLSLSEGLALRGTVRDGLGQAVPAFDVELVAGAELPSFASAGEHVKRSFVNADGSFEVSGLMEGDWQLKVQFPDRASLPWQTVRIPSSTALSLVAPAGVQLSGQVLTPGGIPVAGATLHIRTQNGGTVTTRFPRAGEQTDEQGQFQLRGLEPGEITLTAQAKGWGPSAGLTHDLQAGSARDQFEVYLRQPARIRGELHPAAGVLQNREVNLQRRHPYLAQNTHTDERGHFSFEDLGAGEYRLSLAPVLSSAARNGVQQAQVLSLGAPLVILVAEGETAKVVLGTPPDDPIRVHGRVTVSGKPASPALVMATTNGELHTAKTDSSGAYELQLDAAGAHEFRILTQGLETILGRTISEARQQRIDFELGAGEISGRVLLPTGEAAADIAVTLSLFATDEREVDRFLERSLQSGPEGQFRFGLMKPETYVLRAGGGPFLDSVTAQYALYRSPDLDLEATPSIKGFEIQLREPGQVSGVVYASDGRPAANFGLLALDAQGNHLSSSSSQFTGADGRFHLYGLPPGKLTLNAWGLGGEKAEGEVRVVSGEVVDTQLRVK